MMTFDEAYDAWFQKHLSESKGERKQKLEEQLKKSIEEEEDPPAKQFLRNIWWPLFGTLDDVSPEYEVVEFLGKTRFLDLAIRKYPLLVDVEIDGYGPHLKDVSRWAFTDERRRDSCLEILGWQVIRFSYDDVKKNVLECQNIFKHWMNRWVGKPAPSNKTELQLREILKFALSTNSSIRLKDVTNLLNISAKPARALLTQLVKSKILVPTVAGTERIHSYSIINKEMSVSQFFQM